MVIGFVTEEQARMLHRVAEQLESQGLHKESEVLCMSSSRRSVGNM